MVEVGDVGGALWGSGRSWATDSGGANGCGFFLEAEGGGGGWSQCSQWPVWLLCHQWGGSPGNKVCSAPRTSGCGSSQVPRTSRCGRGSPAHRGMMGGAVAEWPHSPPRQQGCSLSPTAWQQSLSHFPQSITRNYNCIWVRQPSLLSNKVQMISVYSDAFRIP